MKTFILVLVIHFGWLQQQAICQNFIGMHKDEIAEEMKVSYKQFKLNRGTVNPHYKYMKFEDTINEKTILFFLSGDNKCTMVRILCDYSNINEMVAELDENFKSVERDVWSDRKNGKDFTIRLTEEEWFFTVSIKEKE